MTKVVEKWWKHQDSQETGNQAEKEKTSETA